MKMMIEAYATGRGYMENNRSDLTPMFRSAIKRLEKV